MSRDLRDAWARITMLLDEAAKVVGGLETPGVADAIDYLEHNELGLAFDVLAEVGDAGRAPKQFWELMANAAEVMQIRAEDPVHGTRLAIVLNRRASPQHYPCPCCGHLVFDQPPGSYAICPVCFWEDDSVQLRWPDYEGGANRPSLIESQKNFQRHGAMEARFLGHVRDPGELEPKEHGWRPIDPTRDRFEPRGIQERPWPADPTVLYWWRDEFWGPVE